MGLKMREVLDGNDICVAGHEDEWKKEGRDVGSRE